jgi:2-amino-4-hydroxy-6-hydroxymethyldihydropteridine diphosphokinase
MKELTLLLGTNLGDRESNINEALERLEAVFGAPLRSAPVIETEACGFTAPPFLNTVVVYRTRRKPENILKLCKKIERSMGRKDAPEYAPDGSRIYHNRIIDIDILLYGELSVNTPQLTIPHPQVETRPFVKQLLNSLPCD